MLIDSHCHIHERDCPLDAREVLAASFAADVKKILVVGTSMQSSREAVEFVKKYSDENVKIGAIIGVHPHEIAKFSEKNLDELEKLILENREIIVGIGEIGLDYFYEFAPCDKQISALKMQLTLAKKFNLPISFHVRDAKNNSGEVWNDFWKIIDDFDYNFRAVLHSYTEQNCENLKIALAKNFYFGVNGISTFAKEKEKDLWREIPLAKMVLETDAPFLAPVPFRGKINQPSFIPQITEHLAKLKNETFEKVAKITTENAEKLFKI
jgi:TatD DNase family protein